MSNSKNTNPGASQDKTEARTKQLRDEKKHQIRKILKDKLNLSNINDLVLCDSRYNGGMFGCISRHGEASGDGAMTGGKDEW